MKKLVPIIIVAIIAIVLIVMSGGTKKERIIDWEETFDEKSNQPYGLSVLYKEFPRLFSDQKIRTVYHTPYVYLNANSEYGFGDHVAKGNFVLIGNSDYLEYDSVDKLLDFVENGNTLFISDYWLTSRFTDALGVNIAYDETGIDSTYQLALDYYKFKPNVTNVNKSVDFSYFSYFDIDEHEVLGYADENNTRPNFLNIPHGDGNVLLHLEPKIFTNYQLLKGNSFKYVENTMSYLPEADIYFDSFMKKYSGYDNNNNVRRDSELGWFLQQTPFRWAWYLALLLTIIFIIFNAKRRQRVIKVVKPLQNTTVAFVKTISNLYFETKDHNNLVDKKITYFLENIRTDYNLDTSNLDSNFVSLLASKSGKKRDDIKQLVHYINWLRSRDEYFENNLLNLNKHIEAFYLD